MIENVQHFAGAYWASLGRSVPLMCLMAVIFTGLTVATTQCNRQSAWWRNPGLFVDLCYWFALPLVGNITRLWLLVGGGVLLFGLQDGVTLGFMNGERLLGGLPFWAQLVVYMLLSDLILYWTHRLFHGRSLWRYHAIHHSSTEVDWTSAQRFHPVNIALHSTLADTALLLLGTSPEVLVLVAPFNIVASAFVHANLDWSLGPFRYVVAGPVFHRWHHTDMKRGGSKNFSATFPIFDVLFGTFYMPEGALPDHYGLGDHPLPESFLAQLMYPFKKPVKGSAFQTSAEVPALT